MSNYLEHHGIKGQQWGVRRFQNEDGSYTPEGKERYGRANSKSKVLQPKASIRRSNTSGVTGGVNGMTYDPHFPLKAAITRYVINTSRILHRRANAKKEIADAHINDKKERITETNLKDMTQKYTRKERRGIIDRMQKNRKMTYEKAKEKADDERHARILRNTLGFLAVQIAVPIALIYRSKIRDSIGRNKVFQEFARSMKHRKMKDAIVLRKDEWEIDKVWKLAAKN